MKKKFLVEYVDVVIERRKVEVIANDEFEAQEFVESQSGSDKLNSFSELKESYIDSSEVTDVTEVE